MPEHHGTAEVSGRGVDRRTTELERISHRPIADKGDDERPEVEHHHMTGVFRARQPRREQGEARLHEEHEGPGEQKPGEVDRDLVMTGFCCESAGVLRRALLDGRAHVRRRCLCI